MPVIAGLSVGIAFILVMALAMSTTRNGLPLSVAEPTVIRIVEGASLESNPEFMVPQLATVVIGVNNTVVWTNEDSTPHVITGDSGYRDLISGLFDSRERPTSEGGAFVMPGGTYEFTFTEPGRYDYHHEPHPWITGTIIALEQ